MKKKWLIIIIGCLLLSFAGIYVSGITPSKTDPLIVPGDVAWMLTSTALVLLMTPGLAFFYGGMIQPKNIISTMLQSFIAMGVVSVIWIVFGFSLAFGDSLGPEKFGLMGNPFTFFMFKGVNGFTNAALAPTIPLALFAMFQLKFAIITPALITGSFAGRVRFSAYILFMSLFVIFIYCPLAHWTWHPNGFLRNWGVLDFAGGTVVHMSAGFAALAGAVFLGPRRDYTTDVSSCKHSICPFRGRYVMVRMVWIQCRFSFVSQFSCNPGPCKHEYRFSSRYVGLSPCGCSNGEKTFCHGSCNRPCCWTCSNNAGCRLR